MSPPEPIVPPPLPLSGVLGIVSPASPPCQEAVYRGIRQLEVWGYRCVLFPHVLDRYGHLAGCDRDRAKDLMDAFCDDSVDAIVCTRGGGGSVRTLPFIDFDVIRAHPKPFVGYSDITVLHLAIERMTGLRTFYGPMVGSDFHRPVTPPCRTSWESALRGAPRPRRLLPDNEPRRPTTLIGGRAEGELCGGCLCLVVSLMGTPYEIDTRGKILFLEDHLETPWRIERMLMQLKLAGKLDAAAGFVLGNFSDVEDEESLDMDAILRDLLVPLGKPTLTGFPCGHIENTLTLPLGQLVCLDADSGTLTLL